MFCCLLTRVNAQFCGLAHFAYDQEPLNLYTWGGKRQRELLISPARAKPRVV